MAGVWWWWGWSMVHLVLIVNPCHKISAAWSGLGTADIQTKETPDSHHNTQRCLPATALTHDECIQ